VTLSLKHLFQSEKSDGSDATKVQPSNWNAEHILECATDKLLGRVSSGTGPVEEIAISDFIQSILDDADASALMTTLGISTFVKTIMNDADAAAVLTTLGLSAFVQTLMNDADAATFLTTLGVSAFAQTILDDADAATMRVTLGITEGSFTPALKLGGASAGMTYTTQVGRYIRTGNLVTVWGTVVLSAKGSSTGAATIEGLPAASSNVAGLVFVGKVTARGNFADNMIPSVKLAANSSVLSLVGDVEGTNDSFNVGNADVLNTSSFSFELTYRTG